MKKEFDRYDIKREVVKVFAKLRKTTNLILRANFSCCGGCACSELDEMIKKRKKAGAIFWHRQSDAGLLDHGLLYVYFGEADGKQFSEDYTTKKIGHILYDALKETGLNVAWNGNPLQTMAVFEEGYKLDPAYMVDGKIVTPESKEANV